MIALSDFYSLITGNKQTDKLGNCTACAGCSIYYKTEETYESCPENKWSYKLD